ncbi:MAG: bifunctional oligoribonuclease/PAP phosphatase NrnA [Candidatus Omnitrophota bacterium]|jgi:phosphoesterase RecJ-like protein|nr:bifunctional oligoribonuclease/PAP phosphatase NrnA [Candidatus Omnitrophota bacterium]
MMKKAVECIRNNKSFLVTMHVNMEGDAVGAALAFCLLAEKLGKKTAVINDDPVPQVYSFLPGTSRITRTPARPLSGFDCFVAVDCSDLKRCGKAGETARGARCVLNIDHHVSNVKFGSVNWVDPSSSSASEMIYDLYRRMKVPLDKDSALLLYTGIMTDTGSFRYTNTSDRTHLAAAEMMRCGAVPADVYRRIYEASSFSDMQALARILGTMKRDQSGKLVWFAVERSMMPRRRMSMDLTEQILNYARSVKEAEVVVLFRENFGAKGGIRVNFRSRGRIDVNNIAGMFGGGGHATASGCTVAGGMKAAVRKVLSAVKGKIL